MEPSVLVHSAAVTKISHPGSLNNKHLFLMVLQAVKSRLKVLARLLSGESLLSGPQRTIFSLFLFHMVEG